MRAIVFTFLSIFLLTACQDAAFGDDAPAPGMSVNDLMVTVITPATDTIWGIEDPQSDEDWQRFIDAADIVIETAKIIKLGGTGPNDDKWASDPAWHAFADRLIDAGVATIAAARNKDVEAMYAAGDLLYAPCEECHIRFHPDFQ